MELIEANNRRRHINKLLKPSELAVDSSFDEAFPKFRVKDALFANLERVFNCEIMQILVKIGITKFFGSV